MMMMLCLPAGRGNKTISLPLSFTCATSTVQVVFTKYETEKPVKIDAQDVFNNGRSYFKRIPKVKSDARYRHASEEQFPPSSRSYIDRVNILFSSPTRLHMFAVLEREENRVATDQK